MAAVRSWEGVGVGGGRESGDGEVEDDGGG